MKNLKEELQKDLNYISKKIDNGYSNSDITIQNIDIILSIADDQHIRLKKSKTVKKYIKEYDDNNKISQEYIDNYHMYKDFNVKLTNIGRKINNEYNYDIVDPRFKKLVDIDDAIKIVGNFFKIYDKDISDYYENFMINGRFFLVKHIFEDFGLSTLSDELLEPYLFLQNSKTIFDITVLAHEIIHIYLSEMQKYNTSNESLNIHVNGLNEVYSHYIEFVILDYLSLNNFNNIEIIKYKKSLYSDLIERLALLSVMLEPTDIDFNSFDEVSIYDECRVYSYGIYFAYYFYDMYLKDKDMAKENITNFMLDSKNKDFRHLINNYGLNEQHLNNYKVLLKHVEKIY